MSVETSAMMSVDFVARCIASRKSDKAGKGYGIVPNVLHIIPIIKTVDHTEHTIISPDVNADNNLPWICDPEYLIAGYTTCVIGERPYNIIGKTVNGISVAGPRIGAVVKNGAYTAPLVLSTDPDEVVTWDGYVGYTAASPVTASYIGLTWYCNTYNAGIPMDTPADSTHHLGGLNITTQSSPPNYPTEEQMIAILTAANVRLKGVEN